MSSDHMPVSNMTAFELVIAGTVAFDGEDQHLFSHLLSPKHDVPEEGYPAHIVSFQDPDPDDDRFVIESHVIKIRRPR